MIFVTVGSSLPFDRLVRGVDELVAAGTLTEEVFGQIGEGSYLPGNFGYERFLDKATHDRLMGEASVVVGHAGIGTLAQAQGHGTPLVVVPRLKRCGELVNDHQLATAKRFEELGYVLVAYEIGDLGAKLAEVETFRPRVRPSSLDQISDRIIQFLEGVAHTRARDGD